MSPTRRLEAININEFRFTIIGPVEPLYASVLEQKVLREKEVHKNGAFPIGEIIFLMHELDIPFKLSFSPVPELTQRENGQLYLDEFLPLFTKLADDGVITMDGKSIPKKLRYLFLADGESEEE
jgi:hypothetical protein